MSKYLIINAYSYNNRGDAAIVVAMIKMIREIDPSAEVAVMSSHWIENERFYSQYGVRSVEPVWSISTLLPMHIKYLRGAVEFLRCGWPSKHRKHQEFHEANFILSAGGGYLYSARRGPLGVGYLNALFHVWLATKLGKVIIAFPQSLGPLRFSIDRKLAKHILDKVKVFYSRENETDALVEGLRIEPAKKSVDVAFYLKAAGSRPHQIKLNGRSTIRIGVTVMDWSFAKLAIGPSDIEAYLGKVADALHKIAKTKDSEVVIFPQVTVGSGDTDLDVSINLNKILNARGMQSTVFDMSTLSSPEEIIGMYSEMDIFIGSRMHSTIFAITGNCPTIALAYQPKTKGTFERIGLKDFCLDIENFRSEDLYEKMLSILDNGYPTSNHTVLIEDFKSEIREMLL